MNEFRDMAQVDQLVHGNNHEHYRGPSRLAYVGRFLRHLVEMIVAMMVGMAIWAAILGLILKPIGYGNVVRASPELRFGLMALFMSVPMILLMRYRGHSWERGMEMVVAMVVPMGAVVLCWRLGMGVYVPFFSEEALSLSTHVAMYLGMILLMLYRHKEYTHMHLASHTSDAQASA